MDEGFGSICALNSVLPSGRPLVWGANTELSAASQSPRPASLQTSSVSAFLPCLRATSIPSLSLCKLNQRDVFSGSSHSFVGIVGSPLVFRGREVGFSPCLALSLRLSLTLMRLYVPVLQSPPSSASRRSQAGAGKHKQRENVHE